MIEFNVVCRVYGLEPQQLDFLRPTVDEIIALLRKNGVSEEDIKPMLITVAVALFKESRSIEIFEKLGL